MPFRLDFSSISNNTCVTGVLLGNYIDASLPATMSNQLYLYLGRRNLNQNSCLSSPVSHIRKISLIATI